MGGQVGRLETTQGANPLDMFKFDCKQKTYDTWKLVSRNIFTPIEKFNKFVTMYVNK